MATTAYVGSQPVTNFKVGSSSVTDVVPGGVSAGAAPTRGPELMTTAFNLWTASATGAPPTLDATGITYTGSGASDHARLTIPALKDDTVYEVIGTVGSFTSGRLQVNLYGATSGHRGFSADVSAAGQFTFQITTSGNASSTVQQVRLFANQAGTTLKVTALSIKEVLS